MIEKIIIAQSILWAAAILVVAVTEENSFSIWLLMLLATLSITYLSTHKDCEKFINTCWSNIPCPILSPSRNRKIYCLG